MKLHLSIIITLILGSTTAHGQSFMDNLRSDQKGQGKITVNQSAEIDRLGNKQAAATAHNTEAKTRPAGRENTRTETTAHEENNTPNGRAAAHTQPESTAAQAAEHNAAAISTPSTTTAETETAAVNTNKKIMRHSYKANGYRIQIYSGGNKRTDREKCERIAARVKSHFPDLPIYVHFYTPSWKCRAGNYTSLEEAQSMLRQIKALGYNQACLVKGKVNVQY